MRDLNGRRLLVASEISRLGPFGRNSVVNLARFLCGRLNFALGSAPCKSRLAWARRSCGRLLVCASECSRVRARLQLLRNMRVRSSGSRGFVQALRRRLFTPHLVNAPPSLRTLTPSMVGVGYCVWWCSSLGAGSEANRNAAQNSGCNYGPARLYRFLCRPSGAGCPAQFILVQRFVKHSQ